MTISDEDFERMVRANPDLWFGLGVVFGPLTPRASVELHIAERGAPFELDPESPT